jgi:hypothetical protein
MTVMSLSIAQRQTGQEPHLPQGPRPLQRAPTQLLTRKQQLCVVTRRLYPEHPDVLADIKGWSVHPQWPPEPNARRAQKLTEAGNEVQASFDVLSGGVDPKTTIGVVQLLALEDGQRTDVLRPPHGFGPHEHEV